MVEQDKIWILGNKIDGMKSFSWKLPKIPSFADCDTLVVDLTTLNEKFLVNMNLSKAESLFDEIQKRFYTGLKIICIPSEYITITISDGTYLYHINNFFWSPITCEYEKINAGKAIQEINNSTFLFMDYIHSIKKWDIAINNIMPTEQSFVTENKIPVILPTSLPADKHIKLTYVHKILSKSDDILGGTWSIKSARGDITFLPPLENSEESLNKIFEILGVYKQSIAPSWASKISISGVEDITKKIQQVDKKIENNKHEKEYLCSKLEKRTSLRKLVYATGSELEDSVKYALEIIGFLKIRKIKLAKDDLLFDFSKNKNYSSCSIEIKGLSRSLNIDYLRQLDNWVEDQIEHNKAKIKGLLICNTFHKTDLKKSLQDRSSVSQECLDFAKRRNFCIFPTHILLNTCNKILDNNKLDLEKIENIIASTDGILKSDSFDNIWI